MALKVVQVLPALESERPCGNRLKKSGLARIVRPRQDYVTRQVELHFLEPFESVDIFD
jgi:hypothetical protein